jgi:hypothetical protein
LGYLEFGFWRQDIGGMPKLTKREIEMAGGSTAIISCTEGSLPAGGLKEGRGRQHTEIRDK